MSSSRKRNLEGEAKTEEEEKQQQQEQAEKANENNNNNNGANVDEDEDDEENDARNNKNRRVQQVQQRFCPYLDTINRHALDFDFEKVCCVSNSPLNVYACLICGRFFQGRARESPAYFHALEFSHHVFVKMETQQIFCIPDNYEVLDHSLNDIKFVINPVYTKEQVALLDKEIKFCRALDGSEYIAGTVGLNNIKRTDYVNVVVQALLRIAPLRSFFLLQNNYKKCGAPLIQTFGELARKMWNPRNFKGHVSPHELLQVISTESIRRYKFDKQSDPSDLMAWLLNSFSKALHLSYPDQKKTVIQEILEGKVRILTKPPLAVAEKTKDDGTGWEEAEKKEIPFLFLTLELPPVPLLRDDQSRNIIPQVPLLTLLSKFDGTTIQEDTHGFRRRYKIIDMPKYLIIHMKRFVKNTQRLMEKNITIVNFPLRNLDFSPFIEDNSRENEEKTSKKYRLVANIVHEGKFEDGVFRLHLLSKANDTWYEIQDLHITEILPQMVAISESYIQIYEKQEE